jgi:hypothetical protein
MHDLDWNGRKVWQVKVHLSTWCKENERFWYGPSRLYFWRGIATNAFSGSVGDWTLCPTGADPVCKHTLYRLFCCSLFRRLVTEHLCSGGVQVCGLRLQRIEISI